MSLPTDPDLQRDLQNAVTRLPISPDGIAADLAERGIKAHRGCSTACALAVYFAQEIGREDVVVGVGSRVVAQTRTHSALAALSPGAALFIIAFDEGAYPGLVAQDDLAEATA